VCRRQSAECEVNSERNSVTMSSDIAIRTLAGYGLRLHLVNNDIWLVV
jgi:hypothetical protein